MIKLMYFRVICFHYMQKGLKNWLHIFMEFSFVLLMPGSCRITFVYLKWTMHEFTPNVRAAPVVMRSIPIVDKIQLRASGQLKAYASHALSPNLKS